MKLVEMIVAIICIFIAIYNFDWYDFNRCLISILLFITSLMVFVSNQKWRGYLRNAAVFLAIFLIFKILMGG